MSRSQTNLGTNNFRRIMSGLVIALHDHEVIVSWEAQEVKVYRTNVLLHIKYDNVTYQYGEIQIINMPKVKTFLRCTHNYILWSRQTQREEGSAHSLFRLATVWNSSLFNLPSSLQNRTVDLPPSLPPSGLLHEGMNRQADGANANEAWLHDATFTFGVRSKSKFYT